jgi:hypothetical protein
MELAIAWSSFRVKEERSSHGSESTRQVTGCQASTLCNREISVVSLRLFLLKSSIFYEANVGHLDQTIVYRGLPPSVR